ncbi:MAG TPA: serine hydrolase domain-containing protein, partial [Gemmatimonadaceae bacterium]|nr:serine hydrolase domain-containing protein [Gemmatimonadaceae bacterium]
MHVTNRHLVRTRIARATLIAAGTFPSTISLGAQPVTASQLPSQPATGAALSAVFMPDRLARVDSMVERLIAERRIPGAVVMLVRDGRVMYHKAIGHRDNVSRVPLRTDDIFRIASQTKAVTSLAAMILFEEGKFRLDEPVSKYLPEFAKQQVLVKFNAADSTFEAKPVKRGSTIRQLLTHSSGLDYADIGSDEFRAIYAKAGITALGREGDVLAERVAALGKLPLAFEPGERFNYGLSVDVLGRLVEVWSGMP